MDHYLPSVINISWLSYFYHVICVSFNLTMLDPGYHLSFSENWSHDVTQIYLLPGPILENICPF